MRRGGDAVVAKLTFFSQQHQHTEIILLRDIEINLLNLDFGTQADQPVICILLTQTQELTNPVDIINDTTQKINSRNTYDEVSHIEA